MGTLAGGNPQSGTIIDDLVETLFEGFTGLRHYLKQRGAGRPADPTMDSLLSELLRVRLGKGVNVDRAIAYLTRREEPH
jgi:hypothetical protein